MDESPADADSLTEVFPPYPFRPPDGEERPWPDPMAIRLVPVADCNPPFDDELPGGRILTSLVFPLADDNADDPGPSGGHDGDERPGDDASAERERDPGQDELAPVQPVLIVVYNVDTHRSFSIMWTGRYLLIHRV